jgi:hypothetical protein
MFGVLYNVENTQAAVEKRKYLQKKRPTKQIRATRPDRGKEEGHRDARPPKFVEI